MPLLPSVGDFLHFGDTWDSIDFCFCLVSYFFHTKSYSKESFWVSFVQLVIKKKKDKENLNSFLVIPDNNDVNYRVSVWQLEISPICFFVTKGLLNYIMGDYSATFMWVTVSKYLHKRFMYTCIYMPLQFAYFSIHIFSQTVNLWNIGRCRISIHFFFSMRMIFIYFFWGVKKNYYAYDKVNKLFSWRRKFIFIGLLHGNCVFEWELCIF